MRIKSLSIIASFLVFSLAITSCLDSDNDYEASSDDLITAFSLDTIYGETYKFTIDQINGLIYNVDSVPHSADTIINKILIKTLSTNGYVTSGTDFSEPFSQDTLFNYTDSIDFIKHYPLRVRVRSYDGLHTKQYQIKVNRHQVDPDTLVWGNDPDITDDAYIKAFTGGGITNATESKAVVLGNNILVFASDGNQVAVYPQGSQWGAINITTPNALLRVSSIQNLNGKLYAIGDSNPYILGRKWLYESTDGVTWNEVIGSVQVSHPIWDSANRVIDENLITTFSGKGSDGNNVESIAAIRLSCKDVDPNDLDGTKNIIIIEGNHYVVDTIFATATILNGQIMWNTDGIKVPSNFPTKHIVATKSYTTPTGGQQALLIGEPADDATTTNPWFSSNGLNWGEMTPSKTKYALPPMKEPSILYYGKTLYAFGKNITKDTGDGFSYIYSSINGVVWEKIEEKFMFPMNGETSAFKDRTGGYSMVVDSDNYLWMFWNQKDDAWRGKLNRLGFDIQ